MNDERESRRIDAAAKSLSRMPSPRIGVVLGSGLGDFVERMGNLERVPYSTVPNMPSSTVSGHAGYLCFGVLGSTDVVCMQGRVHLYEGYSPSDVVFGVRLMQRLGCVAVLLTNAAGGLHSDWSPGDLMLVEDHLNLMGTNPLMGPNPPTGPRFPDMTDAYDNRLRTAARRAAEQLGVPLRRGVYAGMLGPSYETPAEVRMLRQLGADAVGMSTVPEVIALRQAGVPVGAISCITNLAAGISGEPLDHQEVARVAAAARARFGMLLQAWIESASTLLQ